MYIPLGRTLLNWFMALVAGSFCCPFILLLEEDIKDAGSLVGWMLLSLIFIGLILLPQLITMLVVHQFLNKKKLAPKRFIRIYNMFHVLTGLLTFFVTYLLNDHRPGSEIEEILIFLAVGGAYILIGLAIWMINFSFYRRNTNFKESNGELLDEL